MSLLLTKGKGIFLICWRRKGGEEGSAEEKIRRGVESRTGLVIAARPGMEPEGEMEALTDI